ncbi:MAG: TolC family protein [Candidatus Didemnitutus sp.]|nr:TolC family protein [Candidatus Didemnitutus sp.]
MSKRLFIHFPRPLRALAVLLACAGSAAHAATASGDPLTLSEALAIALLKNPSLQAYAFESRVAEARVLQAGIRPNPELAVGVENFLGTGALSGVKGLETTLQLSQIIDLGGSLTRRVETAESERALVGADYETKRIEVLAEVARRFTEAAADAERLAAARRAREIGEQTVATVRVRVEAAVVSPMELNKARTALALLQIEEEHAEHELAACRQSLAAALGYAEPMFGSISADLLKLPSVSEFAALAARLEKSPVLSRFAVEARWREAQVRLAQSLRRSGLRVSGGLRRVENTDDFGFVAGVSIPLPMRDQQQGAIREARERRAQLDVSAEALRLEMRATLFAVYQEMMHARTALMQLQREVIPSAEETLVLADQGYRAGRFSLLELLDAQKSLIELRAQVVANATAFHLHVIEIERLLGAPILPDAPRS